MRSQHGNLDIDARTVLAQHFQRLRQQVCNHAGRSTEPRTAFKALNLALNIVQRLLRIFQQAACALHQHLANGRWFDVAALARQQWCTYTFFKLSNMQADRWRGQVQSARRLNK